MGFLSSLRGLPRTYSRFTNCAAVPRVRWNIAVHPVGAHFICARAGLRSAEGLRVSQLPYGRIYNPPLQRRYQNPTAPVGVDVLIDPCRATFGGRLAGIAAALRADI